MDWCVSERSKATVLGITADRLAHLDRLQQLAQAVKDLEFSHILLLGMGSSSLCPEVTGSLWYYRPQLGRN